MSDNRNLYNGFDAKLKFVISVLMIYYDGIELLLNRDLFAERFESQYLRLRPEPGGYDKFDSEQRNAEYGRTFV